MGSLWPPMPQQDLLLLLTTTAALTARLRLIVPGLFGLLIFILGGGATLAAALAAPFRALLTAFIRGLATLTAAFGVRLLIATGSLAALAARLRRSFRVVLEVAAGNFTAFGTRLRSTLRIVGKVARVTVFITGHLHILHKRRPLQRGRIVYEYGQYRGRSMRATSGKDKPLPVVGSG